jgi:MraZ protein
VVTSGNANPGRFGGFCVVFTGTFERALDSKARFLLPKRMRSELGDDAVVFLTPGTDRCLELHTSESLNQLADRANRSAAGAKKIKSFSRLFYAQAEQCDIDAQGRIRIPRSLIAHAELTKDVVIAGVGFNWEIWDSIHWKAYLQQHEDEFDRIALSTFDHVDFDPGQDGVGDADRDSAAPSLKQTNPR